VDGILRVGAVIRNTGDRAGEEIVQLYVRDVVCSVTRPVRELKGLQRVALAAGEEREVVFEVPAQELGCHGLDMRYSVEPGRFKVWVGPDSTRGLEGEFECS
jgi:beta-glucosidase